METGKRYHIAMALGFLARQSDAGLDEALVDKSGRFLSAADAREALAEMKMAGLIVVPPCENADERGFCKGHPLREGGAR